jgi:hypothetical protein
MESEETPNGRLRRVALTVREAIAGLTAQSGLIGAAPPPYQFLVAVQTPQGMGVLFALPGDEFLGDVEQVLDLAEQPKGVALNPTLLAWDNEGDAP